MIMAIVIVMAQFSGVQLLFCFNRLALVRTVYVFSWRENGDLQVCVYRVVSATKVRVGGELRSG